MLYSVGRGGVSWKLVLQFVLLYMWNNIACGGGRGNEEAGNTKLN